jgi:hypothetical protein
MVSCEICGKEFKNTQGLRGHKTFVHGQTSNTEIATGVTTGQRISKLEQQPSSTQLLSELEDRLEQLSADSQNIPEHSHPHTHSEPSELKDLIKAVCGYEAPYLVSVGKGSLVKRIEVLEKFMSEYGDMLVLCKKWHEAERAKLALHNKILTACKTSTCKLGGQKLNLCTGGKS